MSQEGKPKAPKEMRNPLWGRVAVLIILLLVAITALALEKPTGGVKGQIGIERPGFGIESLDIRGRKVYALAVGPRSSNNPIERGVWVNLDGTFSMSQLPVGEYTLRWRAPGYATETRSGIFVDEGKFTNINQAVVMHPLEPSVNVAANSRVFTTKETPGFWMNANGATDATVKIYPASILTLVKNQDKNRALEFGGELSVYKTSTNNENPFKNQKPIAELKRRLETDSEDWAHAEFKLNNALPAGDYIAIAEVENKTIPKEARELANKTTAWNLMWFNVTDIGLVMKQAPDKWVARAINLNTLKPAPNVSIQLMDRDSNWKPLGNGKTDSNGFVDISLKSYKAKSYGYSFLAYATANVAGKTQHTYGGIQYWKSDSDNYQTYFYTERPVYRLGQSVYFKGIVRKKDTFGFHNPGGNLPVSIMVEDPDSNKLQEFSAHTTAHGSFNGLIDIPEGGKTGAYQITMTYPDGSRDYESFEVAQYRKPEYQVDVIPIVASPEKPVMAGESVKARIRATYYFGAPVANAVVKYSIYAKPDWSKRNQMMPRPEYYGYFDGWDDGESNYDDGYSGEYITEGYAQTDEAGEALITFQSQSNNATPVGPYDSDPIDKKYKIQAEVTDLSRMSVIGNASVPVAPGEFALFTNLTQGVYKSGERAIAVVSARDYAGKPVSNQPVTVQLKRWVWDSQKQEYRGQEVLHSIDVKTRKDGSIRIKFPLDKTAPTDTYYVTAESKDSAGRVIRNTESLWIANANSPYVVSQHESEKQPLTITLDKSAYKPNDTARVMISAPTNGKENLSAIVAVEGRTLHRYFSVPLTSTAQLVEIPIIGNYAPNAYISVTIVGKKKQYYHDSKMLKVSPESHFLRLAVTTDKEKYHPGDQVTYTIQATNQQGRAVPNTEVSLGVVDESIYAIRPEAATPIDKFFYRKIENDVLTVNSFPEEYSAGPDKIEPRVRKDFRDMAAWLPSLITDAKGLARTTVKLPDNLTTWRATARAIASDADVGEQTQKIISTQDLILRLALPRFYTQGDESLVTAIVHNYTDSSQPVDISLKLAEALQVQNIQAHPLQQRITIEPDKVTRIQWPVKAALPGKLTLLAKAIGKTAGDAVEQSVSVLPMGIPQTIRKSWILHDGKSEVSTPLSLPKGISPSDAHYTLTASNSSIGAVLSNLSNLVDYPYGCTEQTMSRLVPAAVVLSLHQQLNAPLDAATQAKVMAVKNQAFTILKDHQNSDGGWGWWRNDTSNYMMTAYVLEQNILLSKSGLDLPKEQINSGKAWLEQQTKTLFSQLQDPKRISTAYQNTELMLDFAQANAALSAYGYQTPVPVLRWVQGQINTLPPEALSQWAIAASRQQNPTLAENMIDRLQALANKTSPDASNQPVAFMDWDHSPALMKRLGIKTSDYSYRYTGVESSVLGLKAMLAAKGIGENINEADIEGVKNWLLLQRGKDGWDNTKTTAQVLSVLLDEELTFSKNNHPSSQLTLWASWLASKQTQPQTLTFDASTRYQTESLIWDATLAEMGLTATDKLSLKESGQGRIYVNQWISYMLPLTPGSTIPLPASPSGLSIDREFFRLKPKVVDSIGTVRFSLEPLASGLFGSQDIKAGESLLMQMNVNSPVALPYVMVNVPLPSGGEVVSDDPRLNLLASDSESDNGSSGWDFMDWWWTHQDILDDRMVFFTTNLPAGKSKFQTIVRMEMPGKVNLNPVALSTMYHPDIQAFSPVSQLQVVE